MFTFYCHTKKNTVYIYWQEFLPLVVMNVPQLLPSYLVVTTYTSCSALLIMSLVRGRHVIT